MQTVQTTSLQIQFF